MKREELRQWFAEWLDDYYDELHSEDDLTPEVAESVLTALRPVSREQIEKAWRSFWEQGDIYDFGDVCQKCGYDSGNEPCRMSFCPACGAPMSEKAANIILKRLGALNKPLTWHELGSMSGKPVYIVYPEEKMGEWALVRSVRDASALFTSAIDPSDYGDRELYGETWLAYLCPPEMVPRSEACE